MAFRNGTPHDIPVGDYVCVKLASKEERRSNSIRTEQIQDFVREDERAVIESQGKRPGNSAPVNHSSERNRSAPSVELCLINLMSRAVHGKRGGEGSECAKHEGSSKLNELHKYVDLSITR